MAEYNSFYEQHQERLGEFVEIFGIDPSVADNLDTLVEATQPWVKGDHARPENRVDINSVDTELLHTYYDEFGIKREIVLPPGHYDQIIVLGALHRGNNRRLEFVEKVLESRSVTTDLTVILGGERDPYPEVESQSIEENIDFLKGKEMTDPLVQGIVEKSINPRSETDLIRLAMAVKIGNLVIKKQTDQRIDFQGHDGRKVVVTHTYAVDRPNGDRRHTTEACMKDWTKLVPALTGSRIGFVATNPHIVRTTRAAEIALRENGRGDITLLPAGPHALDGYTHELFRGEIARLLFEDRRVVNS